MLSCLWDGAYKRTLAVNSKKVAHVAAAGFLSHYLSGPLSCVRRHISIKLNELSASLNKTFPSFLPVSVEFILGMNGATVGTLICYIFPALFFVRVMAVKSEGRFIAKVAICFN